MLGSFRKAAEHLHATQPAISLRVNSLETSLGVQLFERRHRDVRLTPIGHDLLPMAERIVRLAHKFRDSATAKSTLSGTLRLGVTETVVHAWLPSLLNQLHGRYPEVDVEIRVDVSSNLRNGLVERSLDIGILLGPVSEFTIDNVLLRPIEMVWAVGTEMMQKVDGFRTVADLATVPILTFASNTRPYVEIRDHFKSLDVDHFRIFPSTSLFACLQMTRDNIGVGALPRDIILDDLASGRLIEIELDWRPSALQNSVSYPREPWNPLVEQVASLAQDVAGDRVT